MRFTDILRKYIIYLLLIILAVSVFYLYQKISFLEKTAESLARELRLLKQNLEQGLGATKQGETLHLPPDYKKLVREFIEKEADTFITEEHLVGGKWFVTEYRFLSPDLVLINYEDGHMAGQALLKIDHVKKKQVEAHIIWKLE